MVHIRIIFMHERENMKKHSFVALILLVSILLGLSGGAAAQGVNPQSMMTQKVVSLADPLSNIYSSIDPGPRPGLAW
jgi:hypothetical protein